jgi:hypothetical protein
MTPQRTCQFHLRKHAAVTTTSPDQRPAEDTLEFLRSAIATEWREPALGLDDISAWEFEHVVVLPEPYRSLIA